MKCEEGGCCLEAKGLDIEAAYDADDEPIWAIEYECPEGHKFIAEYERVVNDDASEVQAI